MTAYINTETLEFPLYEGDIKLKFPNTSWPAIFIPPEEYKIIEMAIPPALNWNETFVGGEAQFVDEKWKQLYTIVESTEQEKNIKIMIRSREVRGKRNQLLIESDWTQFKDINPQISNNWAPYRQQLRDITTQPGFPFEVVWPNLPN